MYYKGELFTGTLLDGNAIIQFKNGNAHGKSVEYYDNGQLAEECYFENGLCKF
jgi:antitoxin component YwqK of YwqJK toxin-antitoxin module